METFTRQDIRNYLEQGKAGGARYMLIVCDTFDYSHYAVYCRNEDEVVLKYKAFHKVNMQKVMEIYDLEQDWESQLNERRAMSFDMSKITEGDVKEHDI